jgi:NADPH-dependent 2,4-dienoyl-CoA reductase/sulfur reductase-like enzyme
VLVVGGGPAGLEAARVAALRGHHVTLAEAANRLGGQMELARLAPTRAEMGAATDWLASEVRRLEVEVYLGTRADRAFVEREAPDAVIVATGSVPRQDGVQADNPAAMLPGLDLPHVHTSWEAMLGAADDAVNAVVLDDVGHYEAVGVAEHLLERGVRVTFVTRHDAPAHLLANACMQRPAMQRLRLHASGFTLLARAAIVEIRPTSVLVRNLDSNQTEPVAAEAVVLVSWNRSEASLAAALDGLGCEVIVAGDARASRPFEMAIHDGHRAALLV